MNSPTRTILVTGATGGIGQALCTRLAGSGQALLLAARDEGRLQALSTRLDVLHPGSYRWTAVDMNSDSSVQAFGEQLAASGTVLDGVVLMPPQDPPTSDPTPPSEAWRAILQRSFIGPLALLKGAIAAMRPDPAQGRRAKVVIISGMSSVQVMGHYATSNVIRCAWLAQAKTLAFALGERGIHVNTLSLGGTLTPGYRASLEKRAAQAGVSYEERLAEETANIPLKKYGRPEEVAVAVETLLGEFSDHMTGVNLLHEGGFTRAY